MRNILIAEDKKHLKILIEAETRQYGNECDLNHIDIFMVTDLSSLFSFSKFNGNISNWYLSKVTTMRCMFCVF